MLKKYADMIVELVTSKKFNALVVAVLGVLANDPIPGPAMSEKTTLGVVALVIAWMYAQGQADKGKAVAKIVAETPSK